MADELQEAALFARRHGDRQGWFIDGGPLVEIEDPFVALQHFVAGEKGISLFGNWRMVPKYGKPIEIEVRTSA